MNELITLCGDDCLKCPRYNAKTDKELAHLAELWYKIAFFPPKKCGVRAVLPAKNVHTVWWSVLRSTRSQNARSVRSSLAAG